MFILAQSIEWYHKKMSSEYALDPEWHEKRYYHHIHLVDNHFDNMEWALYHLEAAIELRKIRIKKKYCI